MKHRRQPIAQPGRSNTRDSTPPGAAIVIDSLPQAQRRQLVALFSAGRIPELEDQVNQLLEQYPDSGFAWKALGTSLQLQGKDGLPALKRTVELLPEDAEAFLNLGLAQQSRGQIDAAVASYQRALEIKPDFAGVHINLGNVWKHLGRFEQAVASFRRALEISPNLLMARSNLIFTLSQLGEQSMTIALEEARRYGELATSLATPFTNWPNSAQSGRKLRVGMVSGDLRRHPVGQFLESVVATLSSDAAERIELHGYPTQSGADGVTERIKACCHAWHPATALSDEALAARIRDDAIDILIDLSGHTAHNRLSVFAWKPAPVQATWLGYLGTTGLAAVDYLIADAWTLPPSAEAHFTEKICRLPQTYLSFTPPDSEASITPLPAIANGYITFGSFNNLSKMNDAVVALWARVLAAVPGSRLFLKAPQLRDDSVKRSVVARFEAHGIQPARLILSDRVPRAAYLIPHREVDIALDPFPYPGITTTVESLWMGVPVLTLAGTHFLSRQGVGLLMNAGLPDWIAADADDYVARAVAHAGDLPGLAALRSGLRQQILASPIFDTAQFVRNFETALRNMWAQWCADQH